MVLWHLPTNWTLGADKKKDLHFNLNWHLFPITAIQIHPFIGNEMLTDNKWPQRLFLASTPLTGVSSSASAKSFVRLQLFPLKIKQTE